MHWRASNKRMVNLARPCIMAILNMTPDSFADGGLLATPAQAADAAEAAVKAGAAVLDIGGESTRPGSEPVSADLQMQRVVPAVLAVRSRVPGAVISVDTTSAEVAQAALQAGADAINDTTAGLDDPAMLPLAASTGAGLVLMHRPRPAPQDRYSDRYDRPPEYADVVAEVRAFLGQRAQAAQDAGVPADAIVLDPGLGFGKSVEQNLALIRGTPSLAALGYPVLSGLSRKSFVGRVSLGRDSQPGERLAGTLALSVVHLLHGARIFRVHDVAEHAQALNAACPG